MTLSILDAVHFARRLRRFSWVGLPWGAESKRDLEVHCTCNLLNNCSYNPTISRVTVVMGLIFRL